jgi:DNA-directed RNA polymerase specialized sigma24 family protein
MPDLSRPEGQGEIDALVTDDVQLIILDNLSCLARSGVENDAESWLALQTWALRHRAAGRSVLFIHHSGKNGAQRGTSRREDVLDTVIGLRKPSDYSPEDGARFEVHYEKARGFHGDTAKPFEAKLTTSASGATAWAMRNLEDDRASRIAEMQADGMKPGEIATELGMSRATVYRQLKRPRGGING